MDHKRSDSEIKAREVTQRIEAALKEFWNTPENPECPINEYDVIERVLRAEFSHFDPPAHIGGN